MTTANLFVYVDGVEGPLVVLQHGRGSHRLIVLGADDDDDQVALLSEGDNIRITTKQSCSAWVHRRAMCSPR